MALELSQDHAHTIGAHGEETFPHECCGFILGRADGGRRGVQKLLPADNGREDGARHNRFLITPETYMRSEKEARRCEMDIIGFYHSHPNAPARPSQYDLDHAWPWYSYVIVSVMDRVAVDLTSWVLAEDRSAFAGEGIKVLD